MRLLQPGNPTHNSIPGGRGRPDGLSQPQREPVPLTPQAWTRATELRARTVLLWEPPSPRALPRPLPLLLMEHGRGQCWSCSWTRARPVLVLLMEQELRRAQPEAWPRRAVLTRAGEEACHLGLLPWLAAGSWKWQEALSHPWNPVSRGKQTRCPTNPGLGKLAAPLSLGLASSHQPAPCEQGRPFHGARTTSSFPGAE